MQTVELKKYNKDWYHPGGLIRRALWYGVAEVVFNTCVPWPSGLKRGLLRIFGATIGRGVVVKPKVNIKYPWFLIIGDDSWIGEGVWLDNLGKVSIGANAVLSQGAMLLCGNHNYSKTSFDLMVGDITLEDGAWIGAKALVCPSVTVRSHAVLTAGSVATRDLDAYGIYQGNPAVKIKERVIA